MKVELFLILLTAFISLYAFIQTGIFSFSNHTKKEDIVLLVYEGIKAYFSRIISSVVQIIIYVLIVLYLVSYLFDLNFIWYQMLSFGIGASIITLTSYLNSLCSIRLVPELGLKSKTYKQEATGFLVNSTLGMGISQVAMLTLGVLICFYYIGQLTIIGYAFGVILASFILRIGGRDIQSWFGYWF